MLNMLGKAVISGINTTVKSRFNFMRMKSTQRFSGKVAVITASTDGIGFAIARRLGQEGAKVVVSSRKQENVELAINKLTDEHIDVLGMKCHVGKPEDRKKLIEETLSRHGGIDVLVLNAAVNPFIGDMLDCPESKWDKIFDINVKSTFMLCKEVVPHMEKRGGGSITIISSVAGYFGLQSIGPYSVSKTALLGLVKSLAPSCAKMNIRVNGLAPGLINTNFSDCLMKSTTPSQFGILMNRVGTPDECAGVAAFLASEDASYITGENIVIGGGVQSRL